MSPGQRRGEANPGEYTRYFQMIESVNLAMAPIVSLIAGVLILAMPRLLNYIVASYLIIVGILGLISIN